MVALAEFHTELLAPQNEEARAAGHYGTFLTTLHPGTLRQDLGLEALTLTLWQDSPQGGACQNLYTNDTQAKVLGFVFLF